MRHPEAECPQLRVISLSVHDQAIVIREIIAAAAAGYVLQSRTMAVIDHVLVGSSDILPDVSAQPLPPQHR